ncbi:hypothetical protein [Spiroplasma endosymbiont of Amphibalanus improvisus]|uniref:hypothetical protein n=1 Tax=Spiroplasma endosymbiont of Amphibalanus improvisus TaxID=3066327 RepID=UPI00313DF3FA
MSVNPYNRIKSMRDQWSSQEKDRIYRNINSSNNFNNDNNLNQKNKTDDIYDNRVQIIRNVLGVIKNKEQDNQFISLFIDNDIQVIDDVKESLFGLSLIEADTQKIKLYGSPFLFLLKRIVKSLPLVTLEDKRVLWDRIKLFSKTLSHISEQEQNELNSSVILNEIEFDDPIEYIKNEFAEVLRAYNINKDIVIVFTNIHITGYEFFRDLLVLMHAIFDDLKLFKFISGINSTQLNNYVISKYGENQKEIMLKQELNLFNINLDKFGNLYNDNTEDKVEEEQSSFNRYWMNKKY